MKIYKVKVNGKVYEVELESVSEQAGNIQAPAKEAPAAPVQQAAPSNGAGYELKAPMAGTILDVRVSVGQSVNAGDIVCILEAMKLENEVVADQGGVVKQVAVSKGDSVQNGQLIVVLG